MALHPSLNHSQARSATSGIRSIEVAAKHQLYALTSLRFVAAALIVIGHGHPLFGSLGIAEAAPLSQGVSFFFVLSGFILAYNYPSFDDAKDFQRFFVARFARVWPLHAFTCLLWIGIVGRFDYATVFHDEQGPARLVANLLMVQSWIPLKAWILSFNGVSWSLSLEFFFYLAFPFIVRSWNRYWLRWLVAEAALVSAVIAVLGYSGLAITDGATMDASTWTYFSPLVRILEFTIGVGAARLLRGRPRLRLNAAQFLLLEIAAIGLTVVAMRAAANTQPIDAVFGRVAAYYVQASGLWLFWAVLIVTFAISDGPVARFLSLRPFVFLGEISFALYLVHVIVLERLDPYRAVIAAGGTDAAIAFWAGLLLLSTLLFVGVERPSRQFVLQWQARKRADRLSTDRFPFRSGELCAVVALGLIAIVVTIRPPTTIVRINEMAAREFLDHTTMKAEAKYSNGLQVLGLQIARGSSGSIGSVLLRSDRSMSLDTIIAIHLNDAAGTIIGHPGDFALDRAAGTVDAGVYWIQSFPIVQAEVDRATTLGIVIYKVASNAIPVTDAPSDWGGTRQLFALH